jgi:DNA primase
MAGNIPRHFIDELLQRIDIVDVVGGFVHLRKAGKEYQACCPFHDEKTPSFTVSPQKQFYHCFGCGAHGTAIGFLMDHQNMDFVEAVEELANRAGMEVPHDETRSGGPDLGPLYRALEESARYYGRQLREHPQASRAVDYLKNRGVSGQIAAEFAIGFAPPGWDNLLRQGGTDPDKRTLLLRAGLVAEGEGKRYDRFRDRIMFPIRDRRGRVVGFGARALGDATPKYLNSPETPIFHKGRMLYGLWEARQALRQIPRLLVVEGYMDVVALAQFGIRYAVATLGTATTTEHLDLLFRTAPEIVFCFDGDRAGRDAAWKALETALPAMRDGRGIRFLLLPEGEDPDSLVRTEGPEAFTSRLPRATPLSRLLFEHLESQTDTSSLEGRARLAELALPHLDRMPEGVLRRMMFNELAERTGLTTAQLAGETQSRPAAKRPRREQTRAATPPQMTPIRLAIALLLQHPHLASGTGATEEWRELQMPGIEVLNKLLAILQAEPTLTTGALLERWRGTGEAPYLGRLAGVKLPIPENGLTAELSGALARLAEQRRRQEMEQLLALARQQALTREEKARLQNLLTGRGRRRGAADSSDNGNEML